MPFQDYGYKPSGITRPRARPKPKATSSSYYSGNEFGSGNIFTETSPGASTVNFGNNNNNDNDRGSSRAPSLVQAPTPTVTAPAAPTPAQIEAERQDRIARVFEAAGATLPEDKGRMGRVGRGIDLYSRDIFTTPYVATPDNTQEIKDYLQRTAVDDALRDALGMPEVYQGTPTQEEPEPNIDMSVLQEALMPEPITVEKLEVKAGDTLSSIAAENNLPVQDVIDANPQIKNPDMIRPGEVVRLNAIAEELPYYTGVTTSTDDAAILREAQERLSSTGYYRTTVDGVGGRSTTNAVKTFQFENGLPVTGELDARTRTVLSRTGLDTRPEIEDSGSELLSFIGKGESGGYGAANDYGNGRTQWGVMDSYFSEDKGKPIDKLTVAEIKDIQSGGFGNREVFAVGAYQLIPSTFDAAVDALDIPDDAVFDRELQDRIALEYLAADKRPKLRDWLAGEPGVTRDEAQMALAKEWASIPIPYDITRKGVLIRRGESYYTPEGNTADAHTAEETEALLDRLRPQSSIEAN